MVIKTSGNRSRSSVEKYKTEVDRTVSGFEFYQDSVVCSVFEKMANALKQSTYVTGLLVSKNPKNILNRIYNRISFLLEKMPPQSFYRKYTQEIINQRAAIINSTDDIKLMEEKIGCGQIEEVIQQARNELQLSEALLLSRPWEQLSTPIPKDQWKWPVK